MLVDKIRILIRRPLPPPLPILIIADPPTLPTTVSWHQVIQILSSRQKYQASYSKSGRNHPFFRLLLFHIHSVGLKKAHEQPHIWSKNHQTKCSCGYLQHKVILPVLFLHNSLIFKVKSFELKNKPPKKSVFFIFHKVRYFWQ